MNSMTKDSFGATSKRVAAEGARTSRKPGCAPSTCNNVDVFAVSPAMVTFVP